MEIGKQVTEFFHRWSLSNDEMVAAFRAEFDSGTVWDQRPIPRITGADQAAKFLKICRRVMSLETITVEVKNLAVEGETVHTERIDTFHRADGSIIASVDLAGILVYRDGRLVYWREYYDLNTFALRTAVGLAAGFLRKTPG